jgi:hypothetical protein
MVGMAEVSYVQHMPTKTLRLAHPELCDVCSDLLPASTTVLVDNSCHVTCSACAGDLATLVRVDPWTFVSDPTLHDRLLHRHTADDRQLVSA